MRALGPWTYHLASEGNRFLIRDSTDTTFASVYMTNESSVAAARARLIAAAPDLLQAAKFAIEDIAIGTEGYSMMKAAIKNAEGAQ
jgi:hypothetical protein